MKKTLLTLVTATLIIIVNGFVYQKILFFLGTPIFGIREYSLIEGISLAFLLLVIKGFDTKQNQDGNLDFNKKSLEKVLKFILMNGYILLLAWGLSQFL